MPFVISVKGPCLPKHCRLFPLMKVFCKENTSPMPPLASRLHKSFLRKYYIISGQQKEKNRLLSSGELQFPLAVALLATNMLFASRINMFFFGFFFLPSPENRHILSRCCLEARCTHFHQRDRMRQPHHRNPFEVFLGLFWIFTLLLLLPAVVVVVCKGVNEM